jgi:hypothetical protein
MELKNLYTELYTEFENNLPDEDFIEEDEDLSDEVSKIQNSNPVTDEEYKKTIVLLSNFLNQWFPDSTSKKESDHLRELLSKADNL